MNTFNLSLVFGQAEAVVTFVCASEEPLDRQKINFVATRLFQQGTKLFQNIDQIVDYMTSGIKAECSCSVVTVVADAACMIPRT